MKPRIAAITATRFIVLAAVNMAFPLRVRHFSAIAMGIVRLGARDRPGIFPARRKNSRVECVSRALPAMTCDRARHRNEAFRPL